MIFILPGYVRKQQLFMTFLLKGSPEKHLVHMKSIHAFLPSIFLVLALTACGPTASQWQATRNVSVNKAFQKKISQLVPIPNYLCGAWTSNNAPNPYSSINIYARLTQHTDQEIAPVRAAPAQATIHYAYGDKKLDQVPVSDSGGYVTFYLQLQGQQPRLVAATIDIFFKVDGKHVPCSHAFFTPQ
jgi:hypothetical protein